MIISKEVSFAIIVSLSAQAAACLFCLNQLSNIINTTGELLSKTAKFAEQFSTFPDKSKQAQRNLTLADVQKCDGQNSTCLYVVYNGKVLDLTDFLPFHPGGATVLQSAGGTDATRVMRAAGMPEVVFGRFIKKFIIGNIVPFQTSNTTAKKNKKEIHSQAVHEMWNNLLYAWTMLELAHMAEVSRYTFADVTTRNGKNGQPIWVVYKDVVYDVTKYLYEHPDGPDSILEEAGKDVTKVYDEVGHSSDARKIILKYKIGEIVEEEKRYDANGKKKKRVIAAKPDDKPETRSCFNIITCGLIG